MNTNTESNDIVKGFTFIGTEVTPVYVENKHIDDSDEENEQYGYRPYLGPGYCVECNCCLDGYSNQLCQMCDKKYYSDDSDY